MSERELTKEEMSQELANVKGKPSVPSDGVVFDKVRLDIMGKRAARRGNKPNNKRSKVPEQRDFMSEEARGILRSMAHMRRLYRQMMSEGTLSKGATIFLVVTNLTLI